MIWRGLERVMCLVRDTSGRMKAYYGEFTSFSEFGTIVLEHAVERIIIEGNYAESDPTTLVVQGDSVVTMGTVNAEVEESQLKDKTKVAYKELRIVQQRLWEEEEALARRTGEFLYGSTFGPDDY